MIIERNEFRIKFGKMKDVLRIWNAIFDEFKNVKDRPKMRILTDLSGPSYTLVLELELRDFIQIGFKNYQWMTKDSIAKMYQEFVPLCESSTRTFYNVENEE